MSDRWRILQLQQGDLQLTLLPGIGGRLWDVTFQGQSLLFQNPDLVGLTIDEANLACLPTRSPQFGFPLWGGEKTWIAPDTSWRDGAPFAVLDSGSYEVTSQGETHADLTSKICPISHLSVTRRITLITDNSWSIDHAVTNHSASARPTGIWSVMMIKTPARIGVALDAPAFHPVFGDAKPLIKEHANCIIADCSRQQEFKVGVPNPSGETVIGCGNDGPWIVCETAQPETGDSYAHQHPVEIFNSGDYPYCEAEWHSPMVALGPGKALKFRQCFHIWPGGNVSNAPDSISNDKEFLSCMS